MSKRPIGRPKIRWEDDVSEHINIMHLRNWRNVAQDRKRWKKVIEQDKTLNRLKPFVRRRRCGPLVMSSESGYIYIPCNRMTM
jgi:hypothetical protein